MVDVLYSLVNLTQRFDRLVLDSLYTRDVNMTTVMNINSFYNQTSSIDTQVLSRICEKILPQIHHQIHKLTVDQHSMKQILLAANYPQLYSVSFINFEEDVLYQYLTDDLILRDLLTKQITHLNIDIKKIREHSSETVSNIFGLILSLCKKLTVLNFGHVFLTRNCWTPIFYLLSESNMSSTLIKLKINVSNFVDCLLLLDGRLDCLATLIINVSHIFDTAIDKRETKKLPKLKCFSFTTFISIYHYDTLIVPLLCRMINLEELQLYLRVVRFDSTYIDGIQLYDQFLICMTQLKKFAFNIKTKVRNENVSVELPSNEDIQRSFLGRSYQQVVSYVNTNSSDWDGECHIYSVPYDFEYFNVDNSFQGGKFHKVRQLKMDDTIRFEHKLFQLISQDFPFLEFLYISNSRQMQDKQHLSTLIIFPCLTLLDIRNAHVDYAELFLLKKTTHLPRLVSLCIVYKSLTKITNNFTNDPTHFNFNRLKLLDVRQRFVHPDNFHEYFPLLFV